TYTFCSGFRNGLRSGGRSGDTASDMLPPQAKAQPTFRRADTDLLCCIFRVRIDVIRKLL
ncbi:MAG: hypothetical protein J6J03_01970, partial [Tyzzerella sp.]|nr:hypothetical protein [Tyzzerella sp.]